MKTPHQIAAEIASINNETISFLRAQAQRAFELVNTQGQEQAILDAFPALGLIPAQAIGTYAAFYQTLTALDQGAGLTAPNLQVFQSQEDGSVLYAAPEISVPE